MRLDWSAFLKVLNESKRVVLTSHVRPDCDALGSAMNEVHYGDPFIT